MSSTSSFSGSNSEQTRTYDSVLAEIKTFPERHIHVDLASLQSCCLIDGAIDLALIEAHATHINMGSNGGRRCDVISGPCGCGAWH